MYHKQKIFPVYVLLKYSGKTIPQMILYRKYWRLMFCGFFIPSPTKLRRDIVTLPSLRPSVRLSVFTRMLCSKNLTPWPLTLKIKRVPDSPKDYVCTKVGQNPLKDVDSRVFTRHPCEHSRINILQWILTKLSTFLVLKRIWNPIDFQGQRSRSQIFTA
jgi:hypothetical protein